MLVRAAANNYASREITVTVSTETPPVEIALTTGGKIAGMVVAPDGTPVKGTMVSSDRDRTSVTARSWMKPAPSTSPQVGRALQADGSHRCR